MAYTLTNEGNEIQDFSFRAVATAFDPFAGADNFNAANINVLVDAYTNGIYDPVFDTATFVDELDYVGNPGSNSGSVVVFVVGDVPIARVSGDAGQCVANVLAVTVARIAAGDSAEVHFRAEIQ